MHQLGLQLLKARFGLLPLGEIANKASEITLLTGFHLAHGKLKWKSRAVLALADHDPADADDAPLARELITIEIRVVAFTIWRRHENLDVLDDHFGRAVAEQPLSRRADGLHDAALVDHDHGVRNGVENELHVSFARERLLRACRGVGTRTAQQFAAPRSADPDQHEDESVNDVGGRQHAIIGNEEQPDQQAEKGGEYARPPSAERRCDQDGRYVEQVRGGALAAHRLEKRAPWPCYLETLNERAISATKGHTAVQPMDTGIHCRSLSLLSSTA